MKINLEPYDVSVDNKDGCKEFIFPKECFLTFRVEDDDYSEAYRTYFIILSFAIGVVVQEITIAFVNKEERQRFIDNELAWVENQ